jgi:hypothetical protein
MYEKIRNLLHDMSDDELLQIYREYNNENDYCDDNIYYMDEFDEIFNGCTPWEIARTCFYSGKFCPANNYFWFNGYGNAESSDYITDKIDIDEIAEYIIDNNNSLYNDKIQEILDEEETEE